MSPLAETLRLKVKDHQVDSVRDELSAFLCRYEGEMESRLVSVTPSLTSCEVAR